MSAQVEVLEKKYVDLRERIVTELDRVQGRLKFYDSCAKDGQTDAMEKKYVERRDRLYEELDKVDNRLQSYATMKKGSGKPLVEQPLPKQKTQKMYRGRPVA